MIEQVTNVFYRALVLLLLFINGIMVQQTKLYHPKSFTNYTYNRFVNQFIDKYNFGINKHFRYKRNYINYCFSRRKKQNVKLKLEDIRHMLETKGVHLFYTSKRTADVGMFCLDLDCPENKTYDDVYSIALYIIYLFASALSLPSDSFYFEPSTRGKGGHIYLFIDFSFIKRNRANSILSCFASHISNFIENQFPFNPVDGFKGTYSSDRMYTNRGTLAKMPKPASEEAFLKLCTSPVLTLGQIDMIGKSIASKWRESCLTEQHLDSVPASNDLYIYNPIISISQHFDYTPGSKVKNKGNAFDRSREFYQDYFREYYKKYNVKPGKETCRNAYRDSSLSTGAEDAGDVERLDATYDFVDQDFKPELLKTSKYVVGEYLENIRKVITEEQARLIARSRSSYDRKIHYEDIDMASNRILLSQFNKAGR